jgi:hypothetical protein
MKENNIYKAPNLGFSEVTNLEKIKASNLGYKSRTENGIVRESVAKYEVFERKTIKI